MDITFLSSLQNLPFRRDIYIVGGTVRDILLNRTPVDVDIVVSEDYVEEFVKLIAHDTGGLSFLMDKDRRIYRIINKKKSSPCYYDISPLRCNDIYTDLSLRDFTVDAMAIKTNDPHEIIDPFGGKEDVRKKCIRVLTRRSLEDDPLRLIRAFRIASFLDFKIEESTYKLICELSPLIVHPAKERIRDEFFKILSSSESHRYILNMYRAGLLQHILYGLDSRDLRKGLDALKSFEDLLENLEELFKSYCKYINGYLSEKIEGEITKWIFLKWIIFYAVTRLNSNIIKKATEVCRLSVRAKRMAVTVKSFIDNPVLSRGLSDKVNLYHLFKNTGDDAIGVILLQLAMSNTEGWIDKDILRNSYDSLSWYVDTYKYMEASPLVRGQDLKELGIPPGPEYRKFLELIEKNRVKGLIFSREEAISLIKKLTCKQVE